MKHDDKKEPHRLRELVEAYGTDRERWPADERQRSSDEAEPNDAAWLAEELRLDGWLDSAEHIAPSAALLRRVAEIPARNDDPGKSPTGERASGFFGWHVVRNFLALGTLAAAIGLAVGMSTSDVTTTDNADDDELSMLALGVDPSEEIFP